MDREKKKPGSFLLDSNPGIRQSAVRMKAPEYPAELESWWISAACRATDCDDPTVALTRLEAVAGKLSDSFTVDRPHTFANYTTDPASLAAYGLFFFPQTFVRMRETLRACPLFTPDKQTPPPSHPLRVLDLGCGTGASALAAACEWKELAITLTAIDHSQQSLTVLHQLFVELNGLWPRATLVTESRDVRSDGLTGPFDWILASFVVNELFSYDDAAGVERWMRNQIDRLSPGGHLVVIEPAGAGPCERLQHIRNRFANDENIALVAPCPHRHPCPMLGANRGFCHDVRSWRVPESLSRINRRLQRSVHDLKYGLLVLQRAPPVPPATLDRMRLVAPVNRVKGRLVTRGCCADGALREIELMTRGLSRPQIDAIADRERGDFLRMVNGRSIGDGRIWRVDGLEACRT